MSDNDNNEFFSWWQAVLLTGIFVLFAGLLVICGRDITISSMPPKIVPVPTATPNPYHVILIEQAKASAKVQVITAETDNEIKLRWNIHHMRRFWAWLAIPIAIFVIGIVWYTFFWWYYNGE